jgi:hypothetical protein
MFLLNWKPALTIVLYAVWCSQLGLAQVAPHTILNVNVENIVVYYEDVSDASTFATNPNVKVAAVSRNFQTSVLIGDIVSVNGQPAKGVTVHTFRTINLRTAPTPGQAIADLMRANSQSLTFEFLRGDDSTPIGSIMASGLGGAGTPPPGAPLVVTQGNNTIVGGTGAFLGARGQQGQAVTSQTVSNRQASMTEDPANRRQNGGGKTQFVLDVIPMSAPQIVTSSGAPAIFHADFSPVTAAKPAKAGEVLIAMATGLGPTRPGSAGSRSSLTATMISTRI